MERVRNEYYEGQAHKTQESDTVKRALEDLKYQHEEGMRVLSIKD